MQWNFIVILPDIIALYRPITPIPQWVMGHMEFMTKSKILTLKPIRALQSKQLPIQSYHKR